METDPNPCRPTEIGAGQWLSGDDPRHKPASGRSERQPTIAEIARRIN
jgi:hypothetical protein